MIQQQLASDMATKGYVTVLKAGSISLSHLIHLIPKWPPTVKSWGELHENEVIRANCVCSVNKMP